MPERAVIFPSQVTYPLSALREALLNAVVHRDYTDGSDIQIKIFDDHITIYSPGLLYGGLSLAELNSDNYKSRLRNKLVAEAFYLTGNIEKYGSEFIRIRKAIRDYPELSLSTEEISGGIMLTFAQINQSGGVSSDPSNLLLLIQKNPGLRVVDLVEKAGQPQRTLERWLKQLKDSQLIEFRGAPKAGGYYPKSH